jgi:iron-sulfur cluster assembly protein
MVVVAVTDSAVGAIRELAQRHGGSAGTGIRIASNENWSTLTLSLADGPLDGDRFVDGMGVPLYLDPLALVVLDGRTLDAEIGDDGSVIFSITDRSD